MTMLPLKTAISDTYPNPSNATARAGFAQMWDALYEFQQKSELDLASAATCDIGGQASTKLRITGTTGITSFGTNYRGPIMLRFSGAVAITHNSTTLVCPSSASFTTVAGDVYTAWPIASVSGTIDGWRIAPLSGASIPPATVMAFFQAAAPTGWTQVTTHNNKALRIVSGTGGGSGGSVAFTTAFASQAVSGSNSATTLNSGQIPDHSHTTTYYGTSGGGTAPSSGGAPSGGTAVSTNAYVGGGGSHNHTFTGTAINLAVQYIDMILASKN